MSVHMHTRVIRTGWYEMSSPDDHTYTCTDQLVYIQWSCTTIQWLRFDSLWDVERLTHVLLW